MFLLLTIAGLATQASAQVEQQALESIFELDDASRTIDPSQRTDVDGVIHNVRLRRAGLDKLFGSDGRLPQVNDRFITSLRRLSSSAPKTTIYKIDRVKVIRRRFLDEPRLLIAGTAEGSRFYAIAHGSSYTIRFVEQDGGQQERVIEARFSKEDTQTDVRFFREPPLIAEHDAIPAPGSGTSGVDTDPPFETSADPAQIDLLVPYTLDAMVSEGGPAAMQNLIIIAEDTINQGFINSGVQASVQVVGTMQISNLIETMGASSALSAITSTNDGIDDEIHAERDLVGADLVAVISDSVGGYCGIAYLWQSISANFESAAFSITAHTCVDPNYSFAHEVGHNLGIRHNHEADGAGPGATIFPWAFGFNGQNAYGANWRTILSYAPGQRVLYYSNPDVLMAGNPMGVEDWADAARALNATTVVAQNWRPSNGGGTAPPVPTNLTATANKIERIELSWTGSNEADSYNVYQNTNCSGSPIANVTQSEYVDNNPAVTNAPVGYQVSALNAFGESNCTSATLGEALPGSTPLTTLQASDGSSLDTIEITWQNVDDTQATSFIEVFRGHENDTVGCQGTPIASIGPSDDSFLDTLMGIGVMYQYSARRINVDNTPSGCSNLDSGYADSLISNGNNGGGNENNTTESGGESPETGTGETPGEDFATNTSAISLADGSAVQSSVGGCGFVDTSGQRRSLLLLLSLVVFVLILSRRGRSKTKRDAS